MIRGQGLHTAGWGSVAFEAREGAVHLRANGIEVPLSELSAVATERSTTIGTSDGRIRVATLEHVFAALGGLGIHAGVTIVIEGSEAPLADGGARAFASELAGFSASAPTLRIAREGVVEVGNSRYEFAPGERCRLEVEVDFDRLAGAAAWDGDAMDFLARIAPARTFGFEHEVSALLAKGLASHVTPESVVVIGEDRVLSAGAPFTADEPARHKLLDLIGDLYLHGGPPLGTLRATRPGHAATHDAIRRAMQCGITEYVTPV